MDILGALDDITCGQVDVPALMYVMYPLCLFVHSRTCVYCMCARVCMCGWVFLHGDNSPFVIT